MASCQIGATFCPLFVRSIFCTRDILLKIDLTKSGQFLHVFEPLRSQGERFCNKEEVGNKSSSKKGSSEHQYIQCLKDGLHSSSRYGYINVSVLYCHNTTKILFVQVIRRRRKSSVTSSPRSSSPISSPIASKWNFKDKYNDWE